VISIPRGATTLYQAADPEDISRKFEEKVGAFKTALPELKSLFNAVPGKPKVRFYQGKKDILKLYEDEIFSGGEIISAFSLIDWLRIYGKPAMDDLCGLMKANGVWIRDLFVESPEAHQYQETEKRLGIGESKFLPKDLTIAIDVCVYGDTVALISLQNLIAVIIEDPAIAHAQRQFLEFLWKAL
jgi:hypothetical protein